PGPVRGRSGPGQPPHPRAGGRPAGVRTRLDGGCPGRARAAARCRLPDPCLREHARGLPGPGPHPSQEPAVHPGFERARALMSAAGINTGTDPGRTACEVLAALRHAAALAPETGPAPVLAWVGAHEWQGPAHLLAKHRDAPGAERAAWVLALTRAAVPEH